MDGNSSDGEGFADDPGEDNDNDIEEIRSLAHHRSNRQPRSEVNDPDLPAGDIMSPICPAWTAMRSGMQYWPCLTTLLDI